MNNIFSMRRFSQLFVNHTIASYRMYSMSFGVLMGILFLMMVYASAENKFILSENARQMFFTTFMFIGGAIFTTGIFSNLGDKRKAIAYLMLPASNFEKFLVAWLYSFVIFQLVYVAGFYLIDLTVMSLGKRVTNESAIMNFGADFRYSTLLLAFAWIHSMGFFGAILFKKLHFIKTAFSVFVLLLLVVLLNKFSIDWMMGASVETGEPFGSLMIYEGKKSYFLERSEMIWLVPYLTASIALLLWVGAYFKLKETEV
ncbi:hypothetical protein [Pedobacter psychroterrae]|uniref:Uncharacterized protein n=1 Tax=Pedobacter psychroterrae TaxID=2530453 RepID=A0A4R0N8R0_9SPHI|nr:hypothetical protein [Pedobacter psychroterrae]TCC96405.1 hypothetical protein EZ437_21270 [Pedobacter psychroterrae]